MSASEVSGDRAASCLSHHTGCACHEERHALQVVRLQARIDALTPGRPPKRHDDLMRELAKGPGADLPPEAKAAEWEAAARTLREENSRLRSEKQVLQASLDEIQSLVSSISLICFAPPIAEIASSAVEVPDCREVFTIKPWDVSEVEGCGECHGRLGWTQAKDGARRCALCGARSCSACGVKMSVHWSCAGRFS